MLLSELRTKVLELGEIWHRRQLRRPDRFTVLNFIEQVRLGLLNESKLDRKTVQRISEASDDQLARELTRLRSEFERDRQMVMDCLPIKVTGRTPSGNKTQAVLVIDEDVEFDDDE